MQRWEYDIVSLDTGNENEVRNAKETLNKLGQKGWEVCGTLNDDDLSAKVLLKRPLQ